MFLYNSEEVKDSKKLPEVAAADSGPSTSCSKGDITPFAAAATALPSLGLLGDGGSDCKINHQFKISYTYMVVE